jgi:hypothetical protein
MNIYHFDFEEVMRIGDVELELLATNAVQKKFPLLPS